MIDIGKPDEPTKPGGTPPAGGPPTPGAPTPPPGGLSTPPPKPAGTGLGAISSATAEPTLKEVMETLKEIKEILARVETKCGG